MNQKQIQLRIRELESIVKRSSALTRETQKSERENLIKLCGENNHKWEVCDYEHDPGKFVCWYCGLVESQWKIK